jgi:hypothetical protein
MTSRIIPEAILERPCIVQNVMLDWLQAADMRPPTNRGCGSNDWLVISTQQSKFLESLSATRSMSPISQLRPFGKRSQVSWMPSTCPIVRLDNLTSPRQFRLFQTEEKPA